MALAIAKPDGLFNLTVGRVYAAVSAKFRKVDSVKYLLVRGFDLGI